MVDVVAVIVAARVVVGARSFLVDRGCSSSRSWLFLQFCLFSSVAPYGLDILYNYHDALLDTGRIWVYSHSAVMCAFPHLTHLGSFPKFEPPDYYPLYYFYKDAFTKFL